MWRGAEGALAVWKDAAAALRTGAPLAADDVKASVVAKLDAIDAATKAIALKKLPPPADNSAFMSDVHVDAGVPLEGDGGGAPRSPPKLRGKP
jgi:hypothetical protein